MAVSTRTKRWTLEELHSLPDDDNTYELIDGELFVTPPPTDAHETTAARLTRFLDRFVEAHGLGWIYRPRAVVQHRASQVEPDLMVRQANPSGDWSSAPVPSLVVEILSPSSQNLDRVRKRAFYAEIGVPEYWLVNPHDRSVTVVRPGAPDLIVTDRLSWTPAGASEPLLIPVPQLFE